MNEKRKNIFDEIENTFGSNSGLSYEEAKQKREELVDQFNHLPLEEQYEALLEAAKTIDYDKNERGRNIIAILLLF